MLGGIIIQTTKRVDRIFCLPSETDSPDLTFAPCRLHLSSLLLWYLLCRRNNRSENAEAVLNYDDIVITNCSLVTENNAVCWVPGRYEMKKEAWCPRPVPTTVTSCKLSPPINYLMPCCTYELGKPQGRMCSPVKLYQVVLIRKPQFCSVCATKWPSHLQVTKHPSAMGELFEISAWKPLWN